MPLCAYLFVSALPIERRYTPPRRRRRRRRRHLCRRCFGVGLAVWRVA